MKPDNTILPQTSLYYLDNKQKLTKSETAQLASKVRLLVAMAKSRDWDLVEDAGKKATSIYNLFGGWETITVRVAANACMELEKEGLLDSKFIELLCVNLHHEVQSDLACFSTTKHIPTEAIKTQNQLSKFVQLLDEADPHHVVSQGHDSATCFLCNAKALLLSMANENKKPFVTSRM